MTLKHEAARPDLENRERARDCKGAQTNCPPAVRERHFGGKSRFARLEPLRGDLGIVWMLAPPVRRSRPRLDAPLDRPLANRRLVIALASVGTQQDRIARIVGCAPGTLRKVYQSELDDGLSRAVAGAAQNMFRLALKQSSTGFLAARHVLRCFGGPAWKDCSRVEIAPSSGDGDAGDARQIISDRLEQLAKRNAEIDRERSSLN
jgi:hypothetical protein